MKPEEWINRAKIYLRKHSTKVDSGTYGSGYEICSCCYAVEGIDHKHHPECELAILLNFPREGEPDEQT